MKLIDFDWAGKVKYLLAISSSINWPSGVQGLGFIRKEHDLAMLHSLMSRCPRYLLADPKGKRTAADIPPSQSPSKKTIASVENGSR